MIASSREAYIPENRASRKSSKGREVGGGSGRRRAAGEEAETRGRKARCDLARWIRQPSKRGCACRGDPAAGPFDFSAVRACHHRWKAAHAARGAAQECS